MAYIPGKSSQPQIMEGSFAIIVINKSENDL